MRLSLICPTIGRPTLIPLLKRVVPQLKKGDQFIIVADGTLPLALRNKVKMFTLLTPRVVLIELPVAIGDWGCTPCDKGIAAATGDAVFFIGDDDLITDHAFNTIRLQLAMHPDRPHIFAMSHTNRILKRSLTVGHVSSQQLVVPRDMKRMPKMAGYEPEQALISDWVFIMKVYEAWDRRIMYHDSIIAVLEKQNYGGMP